MGLLELLIVILLVLWLVGAFAFPIGGSAVHILIVIVLVLVVLRFARGQRL